MISHLARIRADEETSLAITRDAVAIETNNQTTIEKMVALTKRWIKGLSEVQAYQSRLTRRHSFRPAALASFLQSIALSGSGLQYLIVRGSSIRLSPRAQAGAMPIGDAERLRVIVPVLPIADEISFWSDETS